MEIRQGVRWQRGKGIGKEKRRKNGQSGKDREGIQKTTTPEEKKEKKNSNTSWSQRRERNQHRTEERAPAWTTDYTVHD